MTGTTDLDNAYNERARLVALLATLYPSHIGYTDPTAPDWAVVTIEAPTGQLSWHIARRDIDLFEHVPVTLSTDRPYDGHTTDEKYQRIQNLITQITNGDAPRLHPEPLTKHDLGLHKLALVSQGRQITKLAEHLNAIAASLDAIRDHLKAMNYTDPEDGWQPGDIR